MKVGARKANNFYRGRIYNLPTSEEMGVVAKHVEMFLVQNGLSQKGVLRVGTKKSNWWLQRRGWSSTCFKCARCVWRTEQNRWGFDHTISATILTYFTSPFGHTWMNWSFTSSQQGRRTSGTAWTKDLSPRTFAEEHLYEASDPYTLLLLQYSFRPVPISWKAQGTSLAHFDLEISLWPFLCILLLQLKT